MDEELVTEPVERRGAGRGVFPGLRVSIDDSYAAEEASVASLFVRTDPSRFVVGQRFAAAIPVRGRRGAWSVEVTRREDAPRRGVALRIVDIAAAEASVLADVVAAADVT